MENIKTTKNNVLLAYKGTDLQVAAGYLESAVYSMYSKATLVAYSDDDNITHHVFTFEFLDGSFADSLKEAVEALSDLVYTLELHFIK